MWPWWWLEEMVMGWLPRLPVSPIIIKSTMYVFWQLSFETNNLFGIKQINKKFLFNICFDILWHLIFVLKGLIPLVSPCKFEFYRFPKATHIFFLFTLSHYPSDFCFKKFFIEFWQFLFEPIDHSAQNKSIKKFFNIYFNIFWLLTPYKLTFKYTFTPITKAFTVDQKTTCSNG